MRSFVEKTHQATVIKHSKAPIFPEYIDKVILIVNTASECGFVNHYAAYETLYKKFKDRGLIILSYPTNNFGKQEPRIDEEIGEFCRAKYDVSFPILLKSDITTNPVYIKLQEATGIAPKWNFHKYIIDRTGTQIISIDHFFEPSSFLVTNLLEDLLNSNLDSSKL